MDTTYLKKITGGDTIEANPKYETPFKFKPSAKITASSNDAPRLKATTHGDLRRFLNIPFTKSFPLLDKFYEKYFEPYVPQMFFLCLKVSKKMKAQGMYINSKYLANTRETILEESNSVWTFIKDMKVEYDVNVKNVLGNDGIDGRTVYSSFYTRWCKENGRQPYASQRFWKEMDRIFGKPTRVAKDSHRRYIKFPKYFMEQVSYDNESLL